MVCFIFKKAMDGPIELTLLDKPEKGNLGDNRVGEFIFGYIFLLKGLMNTMRNTCLGLQETSVNSAPACSHQPLLDTKHTTTWKGQFIP